MSTLSELVRELERKLEASDARLIACGKLRHDDAIKVHNAEAAQRAAESRIAQAQKVGWAECADWLYATYFYAKIGSVEWMGIDAFLDEAARRYPAVPEGGAGTQVHGPFCDVGCECGEGEYRPTPTPERTENVSLVVLSTNIQGLQHVRITPADARRIVSLAAQDGGSVVNG